jgi:D-arabinose 1-dehydrogenase-like Zn-dependent alcohol dehydrogenase
MLSYQVIENGKPLEAREAETPAPEGAEVLMRVEACGVCHSDLHLWDGEYLLADGEKLTLADRGIEPPFTMGHEVVGVVAAVGPDVPGPEDGGVQIGDKRVVYPWIGCGTCDVCQRDEELLCLDQRTIGIRWPGGYADHVIVPDAKYLIDYSGLPTELACTYACSGLTAYSALLKTGANTALDDVVLIGAGGVGLSAVVFGKSMIEGKIIVADVDGTKRSLARQSGADETVDNSEADAVEKIREMTGGGATAAIDFVGSAETARFGLDVLRRGGTLVSVGLYGDALPLPMVMMPLMMYTIRGSYVGTLKEMREVIDLARSGKVPPIPVATRPLAEATAVLNELQQGEILGRVVLKP